MSKDDVKELLITIVCCFPKFNPADITQTINTWHGYLRDVKYDDAKEQLDRYIENNKGGYPPSVSNLIPKQHQKSYNGFEERTYTKEFFDEIERMAEGSTDD